MQKQKYVGLEVVRAIAASTVVYGHIFYFGLVPKSELLSLPGQFSTEAVMVFFVLSGAVITLSAERRAARLAGSALVVAYLKARLLRIYPIFVVGLLLAVIAERLIKGEWTDAHVVIGNAVFLQSLMGYIVTAPEFNSPLWSISYEVSYYALFALVLLRGRFLIVWITAAVVSMAIFYPPSFASGTASHLVSVLAFSIPWVMGHLIAKWRQDLPRVPVSFGAACVVVGLVYARSPITTMHFDLFRLTSFALCCCPLILAIVQNDGRSFVPRRALFLARLVLAAIGLALLWIFSPSHLWVKLILTSGAALAALMPLSWIDKLLASMRWAIPGLVYVGSVSYALYAVHVPVIALIVNAFGDWGTTPKLVGILALLLATSYVLERVMPLLFSGPRGLAKA